MNLQTHGKKTGILLVNVGTPDAPNTAEVNRYLREFLMDPYVVDIPFPLRWFLVNILILPKRSKASAELYSKIWSNEGSPLLMFSNGLAALVQSQLGERFLVKAAMRYGKPSIASALSEMKEAGVGEVVLFPLYPQYSLAATESALVETRRQMARMLPGVPLKTIPPFFDSSLFLDSFAEVSRRVLADYSHDFVLFSFHGLPERQVKKTDGAGTHCLAAGDCSERIVHENRNCYRAQSFATARGLAERLAIPANRYAVSFQSRLGRTPWIKPFTDEFYRTLPKKGIKRLAVVCPSFVADCLETLEEVQIRGRDEFIRSGGEELKLIPSLNTTESWVRAVAQMIKKQGASSG